jgi:hypothetical protein
MELVSASRHNEKPAMRNHASYRSNAAEAQRDGAEIRKRKSAILRNDQCGNEKTGEVSPTWLNHLHL